MVDVRPQGRHRLYAIRLEGLAGLRDFLAEFWPDADSERLPPGASTVEIWLTPEGAGTRVDLEHRQLPAAEEPGHVTGWAHYLARLAAASTGEAGPDPGMGQVPSPPSRPA